jgi:hypothetical protein
MKCCASTRALAKDTFEEIPQVMTQGQGRLPRSWSILTGYVVAFQLLEIDFVLEPAVRISSECGHEFLMDLF